jgi:hypothetical protein
MSGQPQVIPVIATHVDADWFWQIFLLPPDMTIGEAARYMNDVYTNVNPLFSWPKVNTNEVRLIRYSNGEPIDPNLRVKDALRPLEPVFVTWWTQGEEEWWRTRYNKPEDDTFRIILATEKARKPRSPLNLFGDDFERLSIIRRLEREGRL